MRNYRRHSGDGSAKAVVIPAFIPGFTTAAAREPSPESNSPSTQQFRTLEFCTLHSTCCIERATSSREPPSCNSPSTQEVSPSITGVAADVRRLTYPANPLHDLTLVRKTGQTSPALQPEFSSSGLGDLCLSSVASAKEDVLVVKGIFIRQKSRKTPRKAALAAKSRFKYPPERFDQNVDSFPFSKPSNLQTKFRTFLVISLGRQVPWTLVIPGFVHRPSKRMISLPSRFSIHQNPSSNPRKAALAAKSRFQKNPQATDHGLPAIASAKTGQTPTDQPGNVDSRRFPELSNLPTLNLSNRSELIPPKC